MASLGERIKEIRKEQNLTQQQFADSISVSRPFVSRVESNKENPSDSLLKLIGATYHVKYIWLKTGMGNKQETAQPYKEFQTKIMAIGTSWWIGHFHHAVFWASPFSFKAVNPAITSVRIISD